MTPGSINRFPQPLHHSVNGRPRRGPLWQARLLLVAIALGLPMLQVAPALAGDQVLEIPRAGANATAHPNELYDSPAPPPSNNDADAYANASAPQPSPAPGALAANSYPPDPNVGSIDDYQNQPGESRQGPSVAFGGGGSHQEPSSMAGSLILGGILVGMVALEIAAAHHHR